MTGGKFPQRVELRQRVLVASQLEEALGQRHPSVFTVLAADGQDLLEQVDRSGVVTSPQPSLTGLQEELPTLVGKPLGLLLQRPGLLGVVLPRRSCHRRWSGSAKGVLDPHAGVVWHRDREVLHGRRLSQSRSSGEPPVSTLVSYRGTAHPG